ncbi:GntR family transcriptional regulator [Phytoactinopolyspora alkaliphila]|uniref:GntR family transcriptional regulator n=1 Tax=Phytoactinopolyspora alkaliphila TaxID=1783498 RepID=A0A6N9YSA8_9ACTN|nr:GntR family transcriptional regulator [Phytoactinopolyspora alkaliphila]NED97845.1 GntR family transcriptional regulator [Phytoactinopolyspora alkaliphila]
MKSADGARGHKYSMVRERIMGLLEDLNVGDPIPPERVLTEDCNVSRLTVRRAVDDLVRDGYLTRRQGSGTYVARPTITQAPTAASFSLGMRQRGLTPATRVLSVEHREAGARLSWRLHVSPSEQVMVIRRLRLADDEPVAVATTHLAESLTPDFPADELEQRSLYEVIEDRYGLKVTGGTQTVEPTVTNPAETDVLKVPPYAPAFLFRTTTHTADGVVVEFTRTVFRGDRYMISATLDISAAPHEDLSYLDQGARAPLLE